MTVWPRALMPQNPKHPRASAGKHIRLMLIHPSEAALIGGLLAIALTASHRYDGFELFISIIRKFEYFELDEILFVMLLSGISALFLAVRRAADLRREISERLLAEQRSAELAHDSLTGLPNRQLLFEAIEKEITNSSPFAVLLIDLDMFKPVNDLHGHGVGDQLLKAVAQRLSFLDPRLMVARLGGDEFVCLLPAEKRVDHLQLVADTVNKSISAPFVLAGRTVVIGATVGIATYPTDGSDAASLLRSADLAMYSAKRQSKGQYAFYHPELDAVARERAELELSICEALQDRQIRPYFQPIFDLKTGGICGYEALARWEHPVRGIIEPALFLPIVEDLRLQDQLLEAVLDGATDVFAMWESELYLAVNVSTSQLQDQLFAARLLTLLHHFRLDPKRLVIEVTEACADGDIGQMSITFGHLRSAGVRVTLDDFGKKYSNLASLRELKFNHLKIHGSFLKTAEETDRSILHAIVALARELELPVSAQNIETAESAELLGQLGCIHGQGYHFGRVLPAENLASALPPLNVIPKQISQSTLF